MPKYKVKEVYTPHDTDLDRTRREAEFESESTDLLELAVQARISCSKFPADADAVRDQLEDSEVLEQINAIEEGTPDFFAFEVFGNNGDWELSVAKCSEEE